MEWSCVDFVDGFGRDQRHCSHCRRAFRQDRPRTRQSVLDIGDAAPSFSERSYSTTSIAVPGSFTITSSCPCKPTVQLCGTGWARDSLGH